MTVARKKGFRNAEIGKTDRNCKNSKNIDKDENLGINLAQVSCIQYLMTF